MSRLTIALSATPLYAKLKAGTAGVEHGGRILGRGDGAARGGAARMAADSPHTDPLMQKRGMLIAND
jgi:hypothetical protein